MDVPRTMHLFAGAGGGILADLLLGHRPVCAVEIEPYCRQVLLQRQRDNILPKFPIWDDVRTFDGTEWRGRVDVVCGGFPCQDISAPSAVHRGMHGLDGDASGLWSEMARIISEIRPKYAFVENSPNLTVRGLGRVCGGLAEMGYDCRWGVIGADAVGLDHRRDRIWVVAHRKWDVTVQEGWSPGWRGDNIEHGIHAPLARIIANRNSNRLEGRDSGNTQGQGQPENRPVARLCKDQMRFNIPAPDTFGNPNGLANRVDRTKAIGNGQVPAVAALAWQILTEGLTV